MYARPWHISQPQNFDINVSIPEAPISDLVLGERDRYVAYEVLVSHYRANLGGWRYPTTHTRGDLAYLTQQLLPVSHRYFIQYLH